MSLTPPSSIAPSSVTISGTVAVSVASLPLPAGAATDTTLVRVNDGIQEVALTAILERERFETAA